MSFMAYWGLELVSLTCQSETIKPAPHWLPFDHSGWPHHVLLKRASAPKRLTEV